MDINIVDRDGDPTSSHDGKTLLDYIRDEITRLESNGFTGKQVTDLKTMLLIFRRDYGAKYAGDLSP